MVIEFVSPRLSVGRRIRPSVVIRILLLSITRLIMPFVHALASFFLLAVLLVVILQSLLQFFLLLVFVLVLVHPAVVRAMPHHKLIGLLCPRFRVIRLEGRVRQNEHVANTYRVVDVCEPRNVKAPARAQVAPHGLRPHCGSFPVEDKFIAVPRQVFAVALAASAAPNTVNVPRHLLHVPQHVEIHGVPCLRCKGKFRHLEAHLRIACPAMPERLDGNDKPRRQRVESLHALGVHVLHGLC